MYFCGEIVDGLMNPDLLLPKRLLRHKMNIGDFLCKDDEIFFIVRANDIGLLYHVVEAI